ncbi:Anti-repressor SinI [compost metagenome]|uniref:anti-repressor SinI family protein n=1 Tax=Paenibacillus stellifer TaxID=169760 RepID=UPI0009FDCBBF|nr:anti-repressor SinI family protein [Paenibacillus stellifer]
MNKSNQGNNGELQTVALDMEWVQLMLAAKKQGIHADEIRRFLGDKTLKAM